MEYFTESKIVGEVLKIKTEVIMDYYKGFIFKRLTARCFPKGL